MGFYFQAETSPVQPCMRRGRSRPALWNQRNKTILENSWVLLVPWNPQKVPLGYSQHGRVNVLLTTLLTLRSESSLLCFVMLEPSSADHIGTLPAGSRLHSVNRKPVQLREEEGTYSPFLKRTVFLQSSGTSAPVGRPTQTLNYYILMTPITSLCSLSPRNHGRFFPHLIPTWYHRIAFLPFSYLVNNFIPN